MNRGSRATRRRRLLLALLAAAFIAGALAVAELTPPSADEAVAAQARPNVVVVMTDDQARRSMRVMRNTKSLLGSRGVTFQRSFVNYSLCCPSRATFLTGQYMHNHQVAGNSPPNGGFNRFQALHADNNLAVWLQRAGYYTALVGKYLNGYVNQPLVPAGWSEWHAAAPDDQAVYNYILNENGTMIF